MVNPAEMPLTDPAGATSVLVASAALEDAK
jgi:hypothetical protein